MTVRVPAASDAVLKAAVPAGFRVVEPIWFEPSVKTTVPVGTADPACAFTSATKLTSCPARAGFGEALNLMVLLTPVMFSRKGAELLEA